MGEILDKRLHFVYEETRILNIAEKGSHLMQLISLTKRYGEPKQIGKGLDVNAILSSPAPIGVEI